MKTLQANNLSQALAQLKKLDPSLAEKISKEIKASDRNHYHVILIQIVNRVGAIKNDVKLFVQTFQKRGYEKISKNFLSQGYDNCILLHDPAQNEEEEPAKLPQYKLEAVRNEVKKEVQEEMDAEIEKRVEKRMQEQREKLAEEKKAEKAPVSKKKAVPVKKVAKTEDAPISKAVIEIYDEVIENGDMEALKAFAGDNKIDLGESNNFLQIKSIIKKEIEARIETSTEEE